MGEAEETEMMWGERTTEDEREFGLAVRLASIRDSLGPISKELLGRYIYIRVCVCVCIYIYLSSRTRASLPRASEGFFSAGPTYTREKVCAVLCFGES